MRWMGLGVLLWVLLPMGTASGFVDCDGYEAAWDADTVYVMQAQTDSDRYVELFDGLTCANAYEGAPTPRIELNGDVSILIFVSPVAGIAGDVGLTVVRKTVEIDGAGYAIRRDPSAPTEYRLLQVNEGGNLTLRNTTLIGGLLGSEGITRGGALYYEGDVTLVNVTVTGSRAQEGGGLYGTGTLSLLGSRVSDNRAMGGAGGGVYAQGPMLMRGSAIERNVGGGLYLSGPESTLVRSSVSDNTASNTAGIRNEGTLFMLNMRVEDNLADPLNSNGGGINNNGQGQLVMFNTVVRGNRAGIGGGIYHGGASLSINLSTVVDNINNGNFAGSNIANPQPITLAASIVAGGSGGASISNPSAVSLQSENIIEDGAVIGDGVLAVDPLLDTNLVPLPGSRALDVIDGVPLLDTLDIDGDGNTTERVPVDVDDTPRQRGTRVDLGAQEARATLLSDGLLTPADAVYVLNRLGVAVDVANEAADYDQDGDIDSDDASAVLAALGAAS